MKWPELSSFLKIANKFCDMSIFTASKQDYADPIVNKIESLA